MCVEKMVGWLQTAPVDEKAAATDALARAFLTSEMSLEQREISEATITILLDDPNVSVRSALSNGLAESIATPRHVVLALAHDEASVSIPMLAKSPLLLAGELIYLVETGEESQHIAIASRKHLDVNVCAKIAQICDFESCLTLILNPNASISKNSFLELAERFGDVDDMRKCLLARDDVPMSARILLIEKYAMSLLALDEEEEGNALAQEKRSKELKEACDKATITFAAQISDAELHEAIIYLIETSRLNTAFLLRAICMGNISMFAQTLSILGKMPLARVERILSDDRRKAFAALYKRAKMPISALPVFAEAVNAWRILLNQAEEIDAIRLPYIVTRQVLDNYHDEKTPEVDELLILLRKICADAARDNARETMQRLTEQQAQEEFLALVAAEEAALETQKALEFELDGEELIAFAENLADELADAAVQQEISNKNEHDNLNPANNRLNLDAVVA